LDPRRPRRARVGRDGGLAVARGGSGFVSRSSRGVCRKERRGTTRRADEIWDMGQAVGRCRDATRTLPSLKAA
jgi:hypothetical protein